MIEIFRQYLEIKELNNFVEVKKPNNLCKIEILDPPIIHVIGFVISAVILLRAATSKSN